MKAFLLVLIFLTAITVNAQKIESMPTGKYETVVKINQAKWEQGDIILIDGAHYKLSTSEEAGDYKFSSAAQRIFFTSGPLKGLFAKTSIDNNAPAIVLPVAENQQSGVKLNADVWCYHKQ